MDDEAVILAALVAKLGGEVQLTNLDLHAAMDLELQRCDDNGFGGGVRFRVRSAVTLSGELADDLPMIEAS